MALTPFRALFSDIGGVIGTNGWDTALRQKVSQRFKCDVEEVQARHRLLFDSYERGFLTFEEYLRKVFFFRSRDFTVEDVREYAFAQSIAWPENIALLSRVKSANRIKLAFISNEGEGLTQYRVEKFGLSMLADFVVFSCFVHMRKPDFEIWELALKLAQVKASESIYIDDRPLFAEIASDLGFTSIHHVSLQQTCEDLRSLGLTTD